MEGNVPVKPVDTILFCGDPGTTAPVAPFLRSDPEISLSVQGNGVTIHIRK
jgi:hypothetical protein